MHLVAVVHFYPGPYEGCVWAGSETMLHTMLTFAAAKGHRCSVITTSQPNAPDSYVIDGVSVTQVSRERLSSFAEFVQPDVIFTHHQETVHAAKIGLQLDVPVVQILHNQRQGTEKYFRFTSDLFIFNTKWVKEYYSKFKRNSLVIHPPVDGELHKTTPGDLVTLVNLNKDKGCEIFYKLAQRMKDVKFLGVEGGHGTQIMAPSDNVEIIPQTSDMKTDVWSRTKLLLMPSIYESYGLVGVEAMHSGIPVIANSTPGLHESLSYAGTFVHRDDLDGWETAIRSLLKPSVWKAQSTLAKTRVQDLDPTPELETFIEYIEALVTDRRGFAQWIKNRGE